MCGNRFAVNWPYSLYQTEGRGALQQGGFVREVPLLACCLFQVALCHTHRNDFGAEKISSLAKGYAHRSAMHGS